MLPSNEAVQTAVENGAGVRVLSRLVVGHALEAGALTAIDYPVPSRRFYMLRHKEHHVAAAEQAFMQTMSDGRTKSCQRRTEALDMPVEMAIRACDRAFP